MPMIKKGTCDVTCYDEGALLTEVPPTVGLACEEALHLGDIVKSGQMRGMQEEMRKRGRERRACNDHS